MIELVIPTFKRLNSQITLSNIPESLLENVTLVVQPQEELEANKIHDKIYVVSDNNIGMSPFSCTSIVVHIGGSVGNHTTTHHSKYAVSELAKDILVQHLFHSTEMSYHHAASSKACTALKDPILLVHPISKITLRGFLCRSIAFSRRDARV